MKIIIDARTATPHFPGIGRYVSSLLKAMVNLQSDTSFHLITHPTTADDCAALCESSRTATSVFSLKQQWAIPGLIKMAKGTVYHSTYYLMPYRTEIPTVFTCYDLIPMIYPMYFTLLQRVVYRTAHRIATRVASHVIAISESTKSDLMRYFSTDNAKISSIPLAADASFRPQSTGVVDAVRAIYGLPRRYCLYVGTNKPHKNLLALIEAWKLLHKKAALEGNSLVIAGRWDSRYPDSKDYVLTAGLNDSVIFTGEVHDEHLPALYTGATVCVQPSLYEGFGLPIIEAMSCGAPVACSNTSSLPEVAGDAALFFDPRNANSIADRIGEVLADAKQSQGLKEKSLRQASKFSWQQTALDTIAIYRKASSATKI